MKKIGTAIGLFLLLITGAAAQPALVDEIVAVVGSEIILRSEVESQAEQMVMQGLGERNDFTLCRVLEDMIFQKMLLEQARFDSLEVTEEQVESELDRRMRYFEQQFGGRDKMEQYLGKTEDQMKDEFRPSVKEQLLIQQMQGQITGKAKVTPSEVIDYFNAIPKDSLPYVQAMVQIGQIVLEPPIRDEERARIIKELNNIRDQVLKGSKFSLKALVYSEDPGSAQNGGELGFMRREDLVPEFSGAAFSLKDPNEVSQVVETEYGYHIIQLIERRGELANFRHILMRPKISSLDIRDCENRLDSIVKALRKGTLEFSKAVEQFSQDADTKNNGGIMVNPYTGGTRFPLNELAEADVATFKVVERMKVGEFSQPQLYERSGGRKVIRVLYLMNRTEPHVASLDTDYPQIQESALKQKQEQYLLEWVQDHKTSFYIHIEPSYKDCNFRVNWFDQKKTN